MDGRYPTLLNPRADEQERCNLRAIDATVGTAPMPVDSRKLGGRAIPEEQTMRRERLGVVGSRDIVDCDWSADGRALLVPIDGEPARLTDTVAAGLDVGFSETGRCASFVRDGNPFVAEPATGRARRLTDNTGPTVIRGSAAFAA